MHSNGRFKGKLTERWGRKASGLRDRSVYDSGVAGSNVNPLARMPQSARQITGSADPRNASSMPANLATSVKSVAHLPMRLLDDSWTWRSTNRWPSG